MKKKYLYLLVVLSFVFCLVGCGNNITSVNTTTNNPTTTTTTQSITTNEVTTNITTTTEYVGPESGSNRVGRSGGWDNDIEWCKVHARTQKESSFRDCQFGFRVVRNAQ